MRLAAIIESSDDAIISKDLNGIITSWNAAAERLFGYTAEEVVGKSILTIIPPELHSDEPFILENLRSGRKIDHYETERVRKDGQRVMVSLTISPIKDRTGRIIGASKIARDISDRKRVQKALIESEKLAATGRMAATIAHEINNPLEAITNLAYLLTVDASLSDTARSYAKLMLEEIGRVSEIAKQTLAFYRDSGKPCDFDVCEMLDNIIVLNRPRFEKRGIRLLRDFKQTSRIYGFPPEIRQVLVNLLSNAIEAVPNGGKIMVRVRVDGKEQERIRITVADNGPGISEANRNHIFQPFFTTKGSKGNGLGLWVSQGIAKRHGGIIQMRSSTRFGRSGTVFSLAMPVRAINSVTSIRSKTIPVSRQA